MYSGPGIVLMASQGLYIFSQVMGNISFDWLSVSIFAAEHRSNGQEGGRKVSKQFKGFIYRRDEYDRDRITLAGFSAVISCKTKH
jgi:hypothetical protein